MTASVLAGCLRKVAAAGTAMLPPRRQTPPGPAPRLSAPAAAARLAAAFASMLRRPLGAIRRRARTRGAAA